MQYQHLVFEDFGRKIPPQIDVFVAPTGYQTTINPAIFAEFAHAVYRLGHSMLPETVVRYDPDFNGFATDPAEESLIDLFLNPVAFDNGNITADMAAGAVVRGMTRQAGNHIDEFVTDALRSNLLGLPLDLAAINIARGRDTDLPTLNEARAFFRTQPGGSELDPYPSWYDFALQLKNQLSIVNFIAAYGTHNIDLGSNAAEKRAIAMNIVFGITAEVPAAQYLDAGGIVQTLQAGDIADRIGFLHSEGTWTAANSGLNAVDLWIGGLAEREMPFGGMLGSTFEFVFEKQLENLQNGDRFYYLTRTAGMNFINELEQNSFASMIMQNTNARHLPLDVFSTPTWILEVGFGAS